MAQAVGLLVRDVWAAASVQVAQELGGRSEVGGGPQLWRSAPPLGGVERGDGLAVEGHGFEADAGVLTGCQGSVVAQQLGLVSGALQISSAAGCNVTSYEGCRTF